MDDSSCDWLIEADNQSIYLRYRSRVLNKVFIGTFGEQLVLSHHEALINNPVLKIEYSGGFPTIVKQFTHLFKETPYWWRTLS